MVAEAEAALPATVTGWTLSLRDGVCVRFSATSLSKRCPWGHFGISNEDTHSTLDGMLAYTIHVSFNSRNCFWALATSSVMSPGLSVSLDCCVARFSCPQDPPIHYALFLRRDVGRRHSSNEVKEDHTTPHHTRPQETRADRKKPNETEREHTSEETRTQETNPNQPKPTTNTAQNPINDTTSGPNRL